MRLGGGGARRAGAPAPPPTWMRPRRRKRPRPGRSFDCAPPAAPLRPGRQGTCGFAVCAQDGRCRQDAQLTSRVHARAGRFRGVFTVEARVRCKKSSFVYIGHRFMAALKASARQRTGKSPGRASQIDARDPSAASTSIQNSAFCNRGAIRAKKGCPPGASGASAGPSSAALPSMAEGPDAATPRRPAPKEAAGRRAASRCARVRD